MTRVYVGNGYPALYTKVSYILKPVLSNSPGKGGLNSVGPGGVSLTF